MIESPDNVALASVFVSSPAQSVWTVVSDLGRWAVVFPDWIVSLTADDDHLTAKGTGGERFDLYPQLDDERRTADVEVVDELGSADTLRLRVLDARGGCFVVAVHGRLPGIPDAQWQRQRDAIASGVEGIPRAM